MTTTNANAAEGRQAEAPAEASNSSRVTAAFQSMSQSQVHLGVAFSFLSGALEQMERNGELNEELILAYEKAVEFGRRVS